MEGDDEPCPCRSANRICRPSSFVVQRVILCEPDLGRETDIPIYDCEVVAATQAETCCVLMTMTAGCLEMYSGQVQTPTTHVEVRRLGLEAA